MNDLEIKDAVRRRDGYRCRDCGMTQNEHVEKFETSLHVHRLFPGSAYDEDLCVTLCSNCHGKKPKTCQQIVFGESETTGVFEAWLNLYDSEHRALYNVLCEEAAQKGIEPEDLVVTILMKHFEERLTDYVI